MLFGKEVQDTNDKGKLSHARMNLQGFFDSAGKNGHTSGRIPLAKAY